MFQLKHKILLSCLVFTVLLGQLLVLAPKLVLADHDSCTGGTTALESCINAKRESANVHCFENNEGNNTAIAACVDQVNAHFNFAGPRADAPPLPQQATTPDTPDFQADCKEAQVDATNCGIVRHLVTLINVLSGLVGIVCVIMITFWGIQYTVARDNPQMTATARQRILQTVLALVGYLFIYAFLQWVIPGGVF